ncbi:MAG: putative regulator of sigma factor [Acidimicrobiales bacterium]|nr:putative regulator of sigma factor [Acidimicrobiales bacterium]
MDSRIGVSLRAARIRAGWSREALSYHSGVSFSAIAQIESGRRRDVRSSSLSALADALGVSVDHLIGTEAAATTPHLFEHRLLTYGSDEEFIAATVPLLAEGEDADCVLAITTEPKTLLLRAALGERSAHIEFADWADWYQSPANALSRYREFLTQQAAAGAIWIRIVAEAAWQDRSDAEISAWTRYESLVNLMFAASPVTILCTYDERAFSRGVVSEAHHTHPEVVVGKDASPSSSYREPHDLLLYPDATGSQRS